MILVYLLILLALCAVVVYGGPAAIGWSRSMLDGNRKRRVESDRALNKAENALRSIANGAGNPALEAQIALDDITKHREIN